MIFLPTKLSRTTAHGKFGLTGFTLFGDFLRQLNFDQGLIRNIFFARQH